MLYLGLYKLRIVQTILRSFLNHCVQPSCNIYDNQTNDELSRKWWYNRDKLKTIQCLSKGQVSDIYHLFHSIRSLLVQGKINSQNIWIEYSDIWSIVEGSESVYIWVQLHVNAIQRHSVFPALLETPCWREFIGRNVRIWR